MVFYMVDLTSREDEKAQDIARQKGRLDEQNLQREREAATEKGRKMGLEEERAREKTRDSQKGGMGSGGKVILALVVIVILAALVAFLTISVSVTNVAAGTSLPFTTNYGVTFPEGQAVAIGDSQITVLSFENELISDIDGDRQKLVVGEDRIITERRAVIKTLGVLTLMDTNFQINLKYKGNRDNLAYFDMAVHTSKQVPDILLKQLLPAAINAQPI